MNICALHDDTKYLITGNYKINACIFNSISLFENLGDFRSFYTTILGVK